MAPRTGSRFYLKNGRLDLSALNEDVERIKQEDQVMQITDQVMQITDQELMDLQEGNTATALQEMALMFETEEVPKDPPVKIGDEFTKAFNEERLQEEMQEFGIKR